VPRDADMQQGAIGVTVAVTRLDDLKRNDLIFMPGHVMIYAGDGMVIHAYGRDMTVRRDKLAELMSGWSYGFANFTMRRPG
jgi:cell wall-associated NlpC family hydrolase